MIGVGAHGPNGATGAHDPGMDGAPGQSRLRARAQADEERAAWIALAAVPGIGPAGFSAILRRWGTILAALERPPEQLLELLLRPDGVSLDGLRALRAGRHVAVAANLTEAARRVGAQVVTALDADYPAILARTDPHPPVLYLAGSPAACAGPAVAVVGTRHPSGYGRAIASEIADELARAGVTVVSGLALGIDATAHLAALDVRGRTVAVLPSPVDRIYPPRHRGLAARIIAGGGALLSETPPGRLTGRPDFARRNRIISGLALATVVVEAPDRSGALLTAAAAIAQGRDLYAVPGPIDAASSRGCNRLIADHQAELVTSPVSLVMRLGLHPAVGLPIVVADLSEAEGLTLGSLLQRSASIEELAGRTRLRTAQLASALTLLETRGLVASYGGVTFHPTLEARRIGLHP